MQEERNPSLTPIAMISATLPLNIFPAFFTPMPSTRKAHIIWKTHKTTELDPGFDGFAT